MGTSVPPARGAVGSRAADAAPAHTLALTAQPSVRLSTGRGSGRGSGSTVSAATVAAVQLANRRITTTVRGTSVVEDVVADWHTALTVTVEPPTAVTPK